MSRYYLMGMIAKDATRPRTLSAFAAMPKPIERVLWDGRPVHSWWLVEAESATSARFIIEVDAASKRIPQTQRDAWLAERPVSGRIIAQGGQP